MLSQLHIRNFAVVKNLAVDFSEGMTAITGETGAGKSIALDALGLCLGDRADTDSIRANADKAEISAEFILPAATNNTPNHAATWLAEHELEAADNEPVCILRRVITREGRSKAWINGYPVAIGQLKALAPLLVNIHGQHEHQLLTKDDHQLTLLDQYARHQHLLEAVTTAYQSWYRQRKELKTLQQQQEELLAKRQLLSYQVQELDEFNLAENEFAEIEEQHKRLANSSLLREESSYALNALFEGEHNNAFSLVQAALDRLNEQRHLDPQLQPTLDLLKDASVQIEEAARELRAYQDDIHANPEQLIIYEQRLTQAMHLAKQHKIAPQDIPAHHQCLKDELAQLGAQHERSENLEEEVRAAKAAYRAAAAKLAQSREKAAAELSQRISQSMQQLNMPHGRFVIDVQHDAEAPATKLGTDTIEFLVTTNPGQPLQALAKVASGGELSRISLAVQVITAAQMTTPTLMFDEVDVGVSGPTAATVGRLLRQLATHTQVICVTHLPQVAAKAQHQMMVSKVTDGKETETSIATLDKSTRVIELARLLGGDEITATTKANAEELLAG